MATLEITKGWGRGHGGAPPRIPQELGAWPRRTPISPPMKPGIGSFEDMDPLPWALPVSPSPGPQSLAPDTLDWGALLSTAAASDPLLQKADQCR